MTPTTSQVGAAILATLRAGTYGSEPIRAALSDGSEVIPPSVVVAPPAIGFELLGEGFVPSQSDWPLYLYSGLSGAPHVGVELAFTDAVVAALSTDPTLGGVVSGAYLESTDSASPVGGGEGEPPTLYLRSMRLHVDH